MLSILVVCFGLIAVDDGAPAAPKDSADRAAYEAAQARAGRDARAHVHRVVKLDPARDIAWKHLGFKKSGGRWIKPELVAAAKARAQDQQKADRHWKPILERYRISLQSKDASRRGNAGQALAQIT